MTLEDFYARQQVDENNARRRAEWYEKAKNALEIAQRKAAQAEPWGRFQSRIPHTVGATPEEHDRLLNHERQVFEQERLIAQRKASELQAWTMAGGDPKAFEDAWDRGGGREEVIGQLAAERLEQYSDNVF